MKLKFGIAIAVLLTATLAFAQKVNTDFDHSFDFSSVHTFFVEFATPWGNQLQQDRAKRDIVDQLSAKGWTQAPDANSADVVVAIHGAVNQQKSLDTFYSGGGWGGYGWGGWGPGTATTTVSEVKVGTMVVDVFDAKTKKLVFRGVGQDEVLAALRIGMNPGQLDVERLLHHDPPHRPI